MLLVGIVGADVSYADIQPHPIIDGNDGVPVIVMAWGRGFPVCVCVCVSACMRAYMTVYVLCMWW